MLAERETALDVEIGAVTLYLQTENDPRWAEQSIRVSALKASGVTGSAALRAAGLVKEEDR